MKSKIIGDKPENNIEELIERAKNDPFIQKVIKGEPDIAGRLFCVRRHKLPYPHLISPQINNVKGRYVVRDYQSNNFFYDFHTGELVKDFQEPMSDYINEYHGRYVILSAEAKAYDFNSGKEIDIPLPEGTTGLFTKVGDDYVVRSMDNNIFYSVDNGREMFRFDFDVSYYGSEYKGKMLVKNAQTNKTFHVINNIGEKFNTARKAHSGIYNMYGRYVYVGGDFNDWVLYDFDTEEELTPLPGSIFPIINKAGDKHVIKAFDKYFYTIEPKAL